MAGRLAQEQLQRVGRRLEHGRSRQPVPQRVVVAAILDHLDRALLELAVHRLALELVQLERLQHLCEPRRPHPTALLRGLQTAPAAPRSGSKRRRSTITVAPMHDNERYVESAKRHQARAFPPTVDRPPYPDTVSTPTAPARKSFSSQNADNPVTERPCRVLAARLACRLHRARSAGRSKPLPRAVRGSGKPAGTVDESATGSVN